MRAPRNASRRMPRRACRASRWRCCCARRPRSLPATAPAPRTRSAPWRSAPTRGCSACAGSIVEAQRRNDPVAARLFAEEAAQDAPALAWAGQAVLEFRCAAGDWEGALAIARRRNRKSGAARSRGATGASAPCCSPRAPSRSRKTTATPRARSRSMPTKLAPELVPAAALAGRLLAEAGERRKAAQDRRGGVEGQSASGSRRSLRASALRIRRATGSRACRRWRAWRPAMSKARSRSRAPRSMRASSRRRATRSSRSPPRRPSASRC